MRISGLLTVTALLLSPLVASAANPTKAELKKIAKEMHAELPGAAPRTFGELKAERLYSQIRITQRKEGRSTTTWVFNTNYGDGRKLPEPVSSFTSSNYDRGLTARESFKSGVSITYLRKPTMTDPHSVAEVWRQNRSPDGRFQVAVRAATYRSGPQGVESYLHQHQWASTTRHDARGISTITPRPYVSQPVLRDELRAQRTRAPRAPRRGAH